MVRPSLSSKNIPRSSSTPNTRIAPNRSGVRSRNSSPAPINNISPIMADLNLSSIRNKPAKLSPIWTVLRSKKLVYREKHLLMKLHFTHAIFVKM